MYLVQREIESLTLTDEEPDPDPAHIESIEPVLRLLRCRLVRVLGCAMLPIKDTLSDCGEGGIMAVLDGLEDLCELLVVRLELWGE